MNPVVIRAWRVVLMLAITAQPIVANAQNDTNNSTDSAYEQSAKMGLNASSAFLNTYHGFLTDAGYDPGNMTMDQFRAMWKTTNGGMFSNKLGLNMLKFIDNPWTFYLFQLVMVGCVAMGFLELGKRTATGGSPTAELGLFFLKIGVGLIVVFNPSFVYGVASIAQNAAFQILNGVTQSPIMQNLESMNQSSGGDPYTRELMLAYYNAVQDASSRGIKYWSNGDTAPMASRFTVMWDGWLWSNGYQGKLLTTKQITQVPSLVALNNAAVPAGTDEAQLTAKGTAWNQFRDIMTALSAVPATFGDGNMPTIDDGSVSTTQSLAKALNAQAEIAADYKDIQADPNKSSDIARNLYDDIYTKTAAWLNAALYTPLKISSTYGVTNSPMWNTPLADASASAQQIGTHMSPADNQKEGMFQEIAKTFSEWVSKAGVKITSWLGLMFFGLAIEVSVFVLWLTYPLWFFSKTEKAFTGAFNTLIMGTLYPVTFLTLLIFFDAVATQLNYFLSISLLPVTATSSGLAGATSVFGFLSGASLFGGIMAGMQTFLGIVVFQCVFYAIGMVCCLYFTPKITKGILKGVSPFGAMVTTALATTIGGAAAGIGFAAPALGKAGIGTARLIKAAPGLAETIGGMIGNRNLSLPGAEGIVSQARKGGTAGSARPTPAATTEGGFMRTASTKGTVPGVIKPQAEGFSLGSGDKTGDRTETPIYDGYGRPATATMPTASGGLPAPQRSSPSKQVATFRNALASVLPSKEIRKEVAQMFWDGAKDAGKAGSIALVSGVESRPVMAFMAARYVSGGNPLGVGSVKKEAAAPAPAAPPRPSSGLN